MAAAAVAPAAVPSLNTSGDVALCAADGGGDAGAAPPPPRVSLPLLATIKAAQGAHGLAHGDYRRYRRYCARRLHRLRVTCKATHGKARYTPRPLTAAAVAAEPRLLEVPLMTAERAWAMAMEVKDEASAAVDRGGGRGGGAAAAGVPPPRNAARARRAVLARLAKATAAARELRALAAATATADTVAEADAYVGGDAAAVGRRRWVWVHTAPSTPGNHAQITSDHIEHIPRLCWRGPGRWENYAWITRHPACQPPTPCSCSPLLFPHRPRLSPPTPFAPTPTPSSTTTPSVLV